MKIPNGRADQWVADRWVAPNGMQAEPMAEKSPFAIDVDYDRRSLVVNDLISATATVANRGTTSSPMVMVDLPIPAGFVVQREPMERLVQNQVIEKYEVTPQQLIVYLRELRPDREVKITYQLQATMPVEVNVSGATVYEYYDPEKRASSSNVQLQVLPANSREDEVTRDGN